MKAKGSLAGRTALVTGSGRNIGKAIALAFAREGASVVVNGHRDRAAIEAVAEEIRAMGGKALAVMADVGDAAAVEKMIRTAERELAPVDILVSNVSVRKKQPLLEISVEDWDRTITTNLSASFYLARNVLGGMKSRGFGRIIHISGIDGFSGHVPDRAHNISCKAAVHGLAKAISIEFAGFGITANTVSPGAIDTERDWTQYTEPAVWRATRMQQIPVKKIGRVDDIANACVYLAADSGSFITGQVIHVNGGQYMV
jgi:3-oxoacyl-[acyl-carrier protein] reductase